MGINRIKYQPWSGERSSHLRRVYTISRKIFLQKIKSNGILAILIIGMILVHALPILFGAMMEHEELSADMMVGTGNNMGAYLKSGLSVMFILLLVSVVCSDLISQDFKDKSFVLYFSRPIKTLDYLTGKIGGAIGITSILTFIPLMFYCLVMIGTQTGDDYVSSFNILGKTIIAGILTTVFFVSYGIMISSLTTKKTYAGVGIFMSFFVLTIIGDIFVQFDHNWGMASPTTLLFYSYDMIYGFDLPSDINSGIFGILLICILFLPLLVTYLQVYRKEVGK